MAKKLRSTARLSVVVLTLGLLRLPAAEDWGQFKFDARHSGNVPERSVQTPLGLVGALPATDAIFTAPVVVDGRIFVVDGSGVAFCFDAETLKLIWKFASQGGLANCNNVSSPAVIGNRLHFGTMAGTYYVLDTAQGAVVAELACGDPIFSSPVVDNGRVYFATLASSVYALEPDGRIAWRWDYLKEQAGFTGDPWNGRDWRRARKERVMPQDQFACAWNLAVDGRRVILPAGGALVWLEDAGAQARLLGIHQANTPTLGLSVDASGRVFRQWHRLDNGGNVEILRLQEGQAKREGAVPGTETSWSGSGLLSFSSVSVRGSEVYRTRPQEGYGFCKHSLAGEPVQTWPSFPAIASPVILRDQAVYGGLDGRIYVLPLTGSGEIWSFQTAFGKAISAPVAVGNGRVYAACEDGFLYVLGPGGRGALPAQPLDLGRIRRPLQNQQAGAAHDRFTSFGDWANSNAGQEGIQPPFKIHWVRRYEGTAKHFSTFGGGRMYTHTAEGQIFAVEQETGRLLWRRYFPGVHISYTSPLYFEGRLLVPQAGLKTCRLRCLDAATGELRWEAPFAGSPSWNRQQPPVVSSNLVIYMFGTGHYGPEAPEVAGERKMPWLFEHQNNPDFPGHHQPMVRAYALDTGETAWTRDFSAFGSGGDEASLCLMDRTLYYSCFFGHSPAIRRGVPGPKGITAALDPLTGRILWLTTQHSINGGCAMSGKDQRLYLGGYNPVGGTEHRYVWCLDARDGSLVWQSEPLREAIQVVTVGSQYLFVHAQYKNGYLLDKETGRILTTLAQGYKCTRFTLSEPYLLGSNLDVVDLSNLQDIRLISTGPRLDPSECIGAVVSNGRIFYTGHGGGLQVSQVWGPEAATSGPPWEKK